MSDWLVIISKIKPKVKSKDWDFLSDLNTTLHRKTKPKLKKDILLIVKATWF